MKIEIPKPCNAKFKDFEKTEQGGFCQHCSTEVVDFTNKTDEEIFDFFLKSKGKVCGRLPQQNLEFDTVAPKIPKRGLVAATLSLLSLTFSPRAEAQNVSEPIESLVMSTGNAALSTGEVLTIKGRF